MPRDWKNPDPNETWDLAISYNRLVDEDSPRFKGAILGNPGGPGAGGRSMATYFEDNIPDLNPYYNYIGMDPRGAGPKGSLWLAPGSSSDAECKYNHTTDDNDLYAQWRAMGEQCANDPQAKTITSEQTAYDMDFIRHLLGLDKLNYIGYSYGTWLGKWYSSIFAKNAGLMVLDSALDVTQPTYQHDKEFEPYASDRRSRYHDALIAARKNTALGTDPDKILARAEAAGLLKVGTSWDRLSKATTAKGTDQAMKEVVADIKAAEKSSRSGKQPDPTGPVSPANYREHLESLASTPNLAKSSKDLLRRLDKLESAPTLKQRAARGSSTEPEEVTTSLYAMDIMIRCGDGQWTQGEKYWEAWGQKVIADLGKSKNYTYAPAMACLSWKTQNLMPVADPETYPTTIVLQSEMDQQTVWEHGSASGKKLPNTSFIAVDNEADHGLFPYGTEEVDRPVINAFLTGKMPKNITVTQGKPVKDETVTYEYWSPINKKANHVSPMPNTDPWLEAGKSPTIWTPSASFTTAADMLAPFTLEEEFRTWVVQTYGSDALSSLH